ncbi:hypothetical protein POM88_025669 [Heracleum sosnowskyi]|uniref:Amidase domain-containing protein n=1 Tax=Heracleum sosnowskyi TaxID=360622 RepID=A0AAD8I7F6_9APIA|nr:hypothetical protein POM88_025669 [Heracleum sosnowskyi]
MTYPAARCGVTALRPTFGTVGRTSVMSLSESLDKLGPLCRSAADCAIILDSIRGKDPDDLSVAAVSVRILPPSAVDDPENLDVRGFLDVNKGRTMEAIVEYVRDGSTLHVYLLPDILNPKSTFKHNSFITVIPRKNILGMSITAPQLGSNKEYQADDPVTLWVNKVGPYNNPQGTYNYYTLPFCHPPGEAGHKWGGLGEVLGGNELINSQIDIKYLKNVNKGTICELELDEDKMKMVEEEKLRMVKKARLAVEACDQELKDKARKVAALKMDR